MIKDSARLSEQIFLDYKPKIYGYINSKGVPFSDRDDLFGEIILKGTAYADAYDSGKCALSTWVYMLCRSVVCNYFKKRRPQLSLPEETPSDFDLAQGVELAEELGELARQLALLPDRERSILVLRFYREMSYAEIAGFMQLTEVNVRKIYSRALKKLRERMTGSG